VVVVVVGQRPHEALQFSFMYDGFVVHCEGFSVAHVKHCDCGCRSLHNVVAVSVGHNPHDDLQFALMYCGLELHWPD